MAMNLDTSAKTPESQALEMLRTQLRGQLLLPGADGYNEARAVWNGMIDRRPAAIIRCLGVSDIVAGVNFARQQEATLSIKAGGHNISGLAIGDGAITLDLSLMRGVWTDPTTRTARAQPGALLGDIDRETQLHGLATALGFVSNTGASGLTLGGGFGYLSRRFGWTSDNVLSMDMVTADGRMVRASENENSDLFWALRGGGGNFGVVSSIEYQLFPVGPEILGGGIAWPAERAAEILEMYRQVSASAPPEFSLVAVLRIAPPAPWLAKEIHGKPIVALFACHSGLIEEGVTAMAPIKGMGSSVGDIVQRRSYVSQQSLLDATQPNGRRYYWKSEYLSSVEPGVLELAIQHAQRMRSPHSAIVVFPLGPGVQQRSDNHSAVGNRDARFVFNITASWDKAEDDAANIDWARSAWRDMRKFSTGGTYINFLTEEEGDERIKAAYGKNHARLVQAKTAWDPRNLFRMNKNILLGP
ncbi:MAG: FAD-binding oxidoreductase [Gemmatimonadota bacterium]